MSYWKYRTGLTRRETLYLHGCVIYLRERESTHHIWTTITIKPFGGGKDAIVKGKAATFDKAIEWAAACAARIERELSTINEETTT